MSLARILLLCVALAASFAARADEAGQQAAAKKNTFNILEYQVDGNKVLPAIRIEEAVYPYLGMDKTIDDVEAAQGALQKAYRDAGYLTVLVLIPEQKVSGSGVVHLKVIEGKVDKVRVRGSHYYDLGSIKSRAPELAVGKVPYFPGVQNEMASLNSTPGLRVTPVLRPGVTPGTVEAELNVKDELPLHASIGLNNYSSPNTTPLRLNGMVRYDNLWQKQHSLSLQYQGSPQSWGDVKVLSGTYLMPLASGDQLALYGVHSRSNVAAIGSMTLLGNGDIVGARWVMPLPSRDGINHSFTLGIDYKKFDNTTLLAGADTGHTPISYIPFSAGYSASLADASGVTAVNATLNFKMRGLGDHDTLCSGQVVSQFECMRYNAKPDYFYVRGGAERTQMLPWQMSLYGRLDGQLANGPLISNEQFVAGGPNSVRGYYTAEEAGDDGARGTFELRGPQWGGGELKDAHALAFVDAAHLRIREPLPGQMPTFNLSSAGFGFRLNGWDVFSLTMDIAWPFRSTAYTPAGRPRVYVDSSLAF